MSNIFVRNVVGTGSLAMPSTQDALQAATAYWGTILGNIAGLTYNDYYALIQHNQEGEEELVLYCGDFRYDSTIRPSPTPGSGSCAELLFLLQSVLNADPSVTSYGDIDIQMFFQGVFYEQAPRLEHVDPASGIITFEDRIPQGAQIEIYKYTMYKPRADHTGGGGPTYPPRKGQRYRPDRMLAVGQRVWTVPTALILNRLRNHFRFAYRWPNAPTVSGAGTRGPLAPWSVSTSCAHEQGQGNRLTVFPTPSG